MYMKCPSCSSQVEQHERPSRDNPFGGEAWVCQLCPAIICVNCYVNHITLKHPELYALKEEKR